VDANAQSVAYTPQGNKSELIKFSS